MCIMRDISRIINEEIKHLDSITTKENEYEIRLIRSAYMYLLYRFRNLHRGG